MRKAPHRLLAESILREAARRRWPARTPAEVLSGVGRSFVGVSYAQAPSDTAGPERLRIDLLGMDCVTFVETAVALTRVILQGKTSWDDAKKEFRRIRYRGGRIRGYASRLHYFSDWIADNARRGIVTDITGDLGGVCLRRQIRHLTERAERIPALSDPRTLLALRRVERRLSEQPRLFLPKGRLPEAEPRIPEGSILAVTTDEPGLDVLHAGIAVRIQGRLHLLHASSLAGCVIVSGEVLTAYLAGRRSRTGLLAAVLNAPS